MQKTNPNYGNLSYIQTERTLTQSNCNNSFKNMLRTGDPVHGHIETKMTFCPIKVNRLKKNRPDQISHIFTGEDPNTEKPKNKKHFIYNNNNRSKILFNDYYYDKKPKFTQKKVIGPIVEKRIKENTKYPYTDEFHITPRRKEILQKKFISHNFMREFTKKENEIYNKELMDKNKKKIVNYKKAYDSTNCKRILGVNRSQRNVFEEKIMRNKIIDNDFNINKSSIIINRNDRKEIPYYAKRQHRYASCGRGNGYSYC